jgi:hypothetical protein
MSRWFGESNPERKRVGTVSICERHGSQSGVETRLGDSQLGSAGFGVLPCHACFGVVLFRDVYQLRRRINLQWIGNKYRGMSRRNTRLHLGRSFPWPVRGRRRMLTNGNQRRTQHDENDEDSFLKTLHLVARILPNGSRPVSASSLATSGITDTPVSNPLSPKASFGKISAEAIKMAVQSP